jgi:uncharacterized OB-fold protein
MPEVPAADRLAVQILRCRRCGALDAGPRLLCPRCHAPELEPHEVEGAGTLLAWTVIRRAPARLKALQPYAVCVVDLDAGVRVTGRLQAVEGDFTPGARVRCVARDGQVAIFSPEA